MTERIEHWGRLAGVLAALAVMALAGCKSEGTKAPAADLGVDKQAFGVHTKNGHTFRNRAAARLYLLQFPPRWRLDQRFR